MSHKATNWLASIDPAELSHGEFRALFHLCDCHNPAHGCFPTQEYLRDRTGLSNSGLNKVLSSLENRGLIRRERTRHEVTKRQTSTRYILGFEFSEAQEPTPLSGDGADSTFDAEPSPLLAPTRLHRSGDIIRGTSKGTSKEPVNAQARECAGSVSQHVGSVENEFDLIWQHYPRKVGKGAARKEWAKARKQAGFDEIAKPLGQFIRAIAGTPTDKIPHLRTWLHQERWQDDQSHAANAAPTASQQADAIMGRAQQPTEHDRLMAGFGEQRRLIN